MKSLILFIMMFLPVVAAASGSGSLPSSSMATPQKSPTERAVEIYNAGIKNIKRAWKYQQKASGETDSKKAAKLSRKADKQFARAVKKFRNAVKYEPRLYQAHSSLGYTLKQTGDFTGAMAAYDRCLKLRPSYTPAIEYRAEAYLALGQLDKARQAYSMLKEADPAKADELEIAFRKWVQNPPQDLESGVVENMQSWMVEHISG